MSSGWSLALPRSSRLTREQGAASPASSIFGGRGGIKTESLAGRGNVEGQRPGFVRGWSLLRCEHTWGKPTSGWPRWAFPYWPEA